MSNIPSRRSRAGCCRWGQASSSSITSRGRASRCRTRSPLPRASISPAKARRRPGSTAIGFAILHRCGADFHFLLVGVWRGSNEIWEAVFYRDAGMAAFAPFDPAYPAGAGTLRPTFCVWELGIVAHESAAWTRFLASPRAEEDLERWRGDFVSGAV